MKHFYSLTARLSILPFLLAPNSVLAQGIKGAQTELGKVGTGLGTAGTPTDLPKLIGQLVNAFLGVLGIVFVLLTVYAGYLYMTAQGSTEKTEKAKSLLGQAVIGLVIIVAAYAIAKFVIDTLTTAVGT
jgi:cytochrome bd-type quinol oxidase subunit 2